MLVCSFVFSQNNEIDELRQRAQKVDKDSASSIYARLAFLNLQFGPDSVSYYAKKAINLSRINKASYGDAHIQMGNSFSMRQKNDSAIIYYDKALKIYKTISYEKGIGKAYQSFALVYNHMEEFDRAVQKGEEALEIYKKIGFTPGIIGVYKNLANSYYGILHKESLKHLNSKENINWKNNENRKKLLYYTRLALGEAAKNMGDSTSYFQTLSDYGSRILDPNAPDSALYYLNKSAGFLERKNDVASLIPMYLNIAEIKMRQLKEKDINGAREYVLKAYRLAEKFNLKDNNYKYILSYMYQSYIYETPHQDSLIKYLLMYDTWIDTLNNRDYYSVVNDISAKYETEKKDLQIKNQSLEISAKEKENEAKNKILIIGTIGLLGVLIFAFIAYNNFKKTQKANIIINSQKQQVELQKEEIETQKHLVEEKQKEIIDSINYAQKIQSAVLTGDQVWKKISLEHFIIFQPKDIVSGDFYWAYNTVNNRSVFALADCTGHGVPGGFMSMLGNSFLNEIVVENKIFNPAEILNKLRNKIITSLEQKGAADRRDGMDVAICCWNKLDNTLEFAGANNKLWIIRNGSIEELPGDKMPVGNYAGEIKPFTIKSIKLQKNDLLFLTTDGFADQFGGNSGKKLMSKNLKQFVLNNSGLSLEQQKTELINFLNSWRGTHEQVDDVSVIAVKVT